MSSKAQVLSREAMKRKYGSFYEASPKVKLNEKVIPVGVLPLLSYAEFWGISDDSIRFELIENAPADVQDNLKEVVIAFSDELDDWLAGDEADSRQPSREYIAFSAMQRAGYCVRR